jgi:MFS family permease
MESAIEYGAEERHVETSLTSARGAVTAYFLVNGILFGTWVARIPAIQSARELSHGTLGLALLAIALGALLAMPVAGRLMGRHGSQRITQLSVIVYAAMLPALATIPSVPLWIAALFVFGVSHGALDVAMNAQAVLVENQYRRPIMSSFHALFSAGGLVGAAAGGFAAATHISPAWHFAVVATLLLLFTTIFASPHLLNDREPAAGHHSSPRVSMALPKPELLAIGAVAFCAMMGEGAMADWSGLYLRQVLHSGEGLAAAGYAAFSVAMAGTRFLGDRLLIKLGSAGLVRLSGILAAAGLAVALISPSPTVALAGFACVGMGFATVVPTAFSAAARIPGTSSGVALAAATTVGYFGFLLGPPVIGFVAELVGLRSALTVVIGTSALIALLAGSVRREVTH